MANVSDDELNECYRNARVAVVPLRCGAGVKLNVVEALKNGVPLVTTRVGAQGLPGIADAAYVCDDAASFADAVCALLLDDVVVAAALRGAARLCTGAVQRGGVPPVGDAGAGSAARPASVAKRRRFAYPIRA